MLLDTVLSATGLGERFTATVAGEEVSAGKPAPLIYQAAKEQGHVPLFIAYVTVCIAVSLVVYIFFLKNKSDTYLDRERGSAFQR